jgi:hypothetical protein
MKSDSLVCVELSNERVESFITAWKFSQACRVISTGLLNTLLRLHIQPINLVVYQDPISTEVEGRTYLGRSLALRCFQRLSLPSLATRRYC